MKNIEFNETGNTEKNSTLKEMVIKRAKANYGNEVSSDTLIRYFTNMVADNTFPVNEVHEVQQYIKNVVKKEVIADLDKQIETFKTFQRLR